MKEFSKDLTLRQTILKPRAADELIMQRMQHIDRFGVETWNRLVPSIVCLNCENQSKPLFTMVLADSSLTFQNYNEMILSAIKASGKNATPVNFKKASCCSNSQPRSIFDYYVYHSGMRKDLVVRIIHQSQPKHIDWGVYIADAGGYKPARKLTEEEHITLRRDNLIRFAAHWLEIFEEPTSGLKCLKEAFHQFPGDQALLSFVNRLLKIGQYGLAEGIAREHIERSPNDPLGHFYFSKVLLNGFMAHPTEQNLLLEAEPYARRALASNANWQEANLNLCLILRFLLAPDTEREFDNLLSRWPNYADGHYNYALHFLPTRPQLALKHFQIGEQLTPDDADYPIGCARALTQMRRPNEAWAAILRAKRLNPNSPLLKTLEAQLRVRPS